MNYDDIKLPSQKRNIYRKWVGTAFLVDYKEQDEITDINTDKPNTLALDFLWASNTTLKKISNLI